MKIHCIGGGPAGLFFGILMKKADSRHEVKVWERNARDDTFGWGVVFSDLTQENVGRADPETYAAITSRFATWDCIDVHLNGERTRSAGHGFCGLSRKHLLQILERRAAELGVETEFNHEITDVEAHRDCDLLVGADGLHSLVRNSHVDGFGPDLKVHDNRYIWFGTRQQLEAFTFIFEENEHGLFQVHAYQFEPETSTFIVECNDSTFRRAGLEEKTEAESIAYCEKLFGHYLGGHSLLGNRSRWIQFTTVKNRRWHHENMVLLGDAAHTAHFSIGSGTKLAMEDAIELATAFREHGDRDTALLAYQAAREENVGRIQKAAAQSLDWFERVPMRMNLPIEQFTFNLMTRTRRVTRENLQVRDAAYVASVDRWFHQAEGAAAVDSLPPAMFTPFTMRGLQVSNRVVVSPMCQYSADDTGTPNDWHLVHLGSRAVGGAGLIFTESTAVSEDGRISPSCAGMYSDGHVGAWSRIVRFVHENSGAKIALQLSHAGRKGSTQRLWEGDGRPLPEGNWPLLAPSPLPWRQENQVPAAMSRADMAVVRDDFVAAAKRARDAEFDMIELHFGHGYLLSSYLSPLSNLRTDDYGGSLDRRARFPLEVLDATREAFADRPLAVRISATDWVDGGFDGDQAVEFAGMLKAHGVDIVDVSAGQTWPQANPIYGRAFQMPFSERIRLEVCIPTITVGNITTADQINTIILSGRADLVALARPHLADPYFALHAAAEQNYREMPWPDQYLTARPRQG